MRFATTLLFGVVVLLVPARVHCQSIGEIDCARQDDYVYLYTSMTTLEVRGTLQCHEQVEITGRYDHYLGVRTAKGEIGYVPLSSVIFLKDQPGAKPSLKPAPPVVRERIAYDQRPPQPARPPASADDFTLPNNTPVRVKIRKTLSSASAHVGDTVELEVAEDVSLNGVVVLAKGANAEGIVSEAESKKRMGRSGRLGISFRSAKLLSGESVAIRGYQEVAGSPSGTSAAANPLASGKDAAFVEGTEFSAQIDGAVRLNRDTFAAGKPRDPAATPPVAPKSPG